MSAAHPLDPEPVEDLLAGMRNGEWLDNQQFDPLTYAIEGLLPEGFTLLAGPPKVGKSWLLLAWALAVAAGGRALSALPAEQRPVLYLALEDGPQRLKDRCYVLEPRDALPTEFYFITALARPELVLPTILQFMERFGDRRPLVILDTLGKVMPPAAQGETQYSRDYRIGGKVKMVADHWPGTSVVVNHHIRKAEATDFVDTLSGTHGLAGSADTLMVLTRPRHEAGGLLNVTGRDVAEGSYAVSFQDGPWVLDGGTLEAAASAATVRRATAGVGDRMAEIVGFVIATGRACSPGDVAEKLGMSNKDAASYLRRAADAGRLSKLARGLYVPL